jgi:hypothetical protein
MTHLLVYAASIGLGGLSWGMLALTDWLLRDADEKWSIKSALPRWRITADRARKSFQERTNRSHRQVDYVHEKGRSHLSAN